MAGGKLSPRQKMINLMYLVFIAMLAMNISKEVLSAFGYTNEKLIKNNETVTEKNKNILANLAQKSQEQPDKYASKYEKADKIDKLSTDFSAYIQSLKDKLLEGLEDPQDYESMDKADPVNELFFSGDAYTEEGKKFLDEINNYKKEIIKVIGQEFPSIEKEVSNRFDISDQEIEDGTQPWLNNRYEGFPLISAITNFTTIQTDIKSIQAEIFDALLTGQLEMDASVTNLKAILISDKSAFFQGENFKGRLVLGRYDGSLKPKRVVVNGRNITQLEEGGAVLNFPAGSIGEQQLKGEFVFEEKGKEIKIPIEDSYSVIPEPNSAVISADKMNVVYRGVDNPLTISVPGVPDNLVIPTASGLRKGKGTGKYIMRPSSGSTVKINVAATIPSSGKKISTSVNFRIKDIPSPVGTIRKQSGHQKMPLTSVGKSTIGVALPDFDFDVKLTVTEFTIKVPGQSSVVVRGNRMNRSAQTAIQSAKRGDMITIFNIKSKLEGSSLKIKPAAPVNVEVQ